jgi:hypothetical protein
VVGRIFVGRAVLDCDVALLAVRGDRHLFDSDVSLWRYVAVFDGSELWISPSEFFAMGRYGSRGTWNHWEHQGQSPGSGNFFMYWYQICHVRRRGRSATALLMKIDFTGLSASELGAGARGKLVAACGS